MTMQKTVGIAMAALFVAAGTVGCSAAPVTQKAGESARSLVEAPRPRLRRRRPFGGGPRYFPITGPLPQRRQADQGDGVALLRRLRNIV